MSVKYLKYASCSETYEYGPLGDGVLDLILLNEMLLLECLDGVYVPRIPLLAQDDLAIGARPDHLHQVEVFNT